MTPNRQIATSKIATGVDVICGATSKDVYL
jgi:hypothetical protein